jgi:hypothetical protein
VAGFAIRGRYRPTSPDKVNIRAAILNPDVRLWGKSYYVKGKIIFGLDIKAGSQILDSPEKTKRW